MFRWWGVGTHQPADLQGVVSVSSVPMVGCRNTAWVASAQRGECIKCSDGGVSERALLTGGGWKGVYQVFRWWGVGTTPRIGHVASGSVSSVPMVGCRNGAAHGEADVHECIKCSDGGVSEQIDEQAEGTQGVYQVFRWWGVGTWHIVLGTAVVSVSSVPMVGCRNTSTQN